MSHDKNYSGLRSYSSEGIISRWLELLVTGVLTRTWTDLATIGDPWYLNLDQYWFRFSLCLHCVDTSVTDSGLLRLNHTPTLLCKALININGVLREIKIDKIFVASEKN